MRQIIETGLFPELDNISIQDAIKLLLDIQNKYSTNYSDIKISTVYTPDNVDIIVSGDDLINDGIINQMIDIIQKDILDCGYCSFQMITLGHFLFDYSLLPSLAPPFRASIVTPFCATFFSSNIRMYSRYCLMVSSSLFIAPSKV